ncbi:hypothetical protein NDU88_002141 [Pleurodeles waltl]|uniref:Uncharacterized protein n=1 Tax=Pleurodeles waltl TaxID=8319 RepID=A0AAV7NCW0_PLEWA|nr:hypothetical protein NDU88_002141 [Pleurodeles waltl]
MFKGAVESYNAQLTSLGYSAVVISDHSCCPSGSKHSSPGCTTRSRDVLRDPILPAKRLPLLVKNGRLICDLRRGTCNQRTQGSHWQALAFWQTSLVPP